MYLAILMGSIHFMLLSNIFHACNSVSTFTIIFSGIYFKKYPCLFYALVSNIDPTTSLDLKINVLAIL